MADRAGTTPPGDRRPPVTVSAPGGTRLAQDLLAGGDEPRPLGRGTRVLVALAVAAVLVAAVASGGDDPVRADRDHGPAARVSSVRELPGAAASAVRLAVAVRSTGGPLEVVSTHVVAAPVRSRPVVRERAERLTAGADARVVVDLEPGCADLPPGGLTAALVLGLRAPDGRRAELREDLSTELALQARLAALCRAPDAPGRLSVALAAPDAGGDRLRVRVELVSPPRRGLLLQWLRAPGLAVDPAVPLPLGGAPGGTTVLGATVSVADCGRVARPVPGDDVLRFPWGALTAVVSRVGGYGVSTSTLESVAAPGGGRDRYADAVRRLVERRCR